MRCSRGVGFDKKHAACPASYHDDVWGTPVRTSRELFTQLSLASQQAGLSWSVVWNKREAYREAFHDWDMR